MKKYGFLLLAICFFWAVAVPLQIVQASSFVGIDGTIHNENGDEVAIGAGAYEIWQAMNNIPEGNIYGDITLKDSMGHSLGLIFNNIDVTSVTLVKGYYFGYPMKYVADEVVLGEFIFKAFDKNGVVHSYLYTQTDKDSRYVGNSSDLNTGWSFVQDGDDYKYPPFIKSDYEGKIRYSGEPYRKNLTGDEIRKINEDFRWQVANGDIVNHRE